MSTDSTSLRHLSEKKNWENVKDQFGGHKKEGSGSNDGVRRVKSPMKKGGELFNERRSLNCAIWKQSKKTNNLGGYRGINYGAQPFLISLHKLGKRGQVDSCN